MNLPERFSNLPENAFPRLRNLLDPKVRYTQGGLSTREYRKGREIAVSLEWQPGRD